MATIARVKAKSQWKPVEFSRFKDSNGDFDGIISFEELTDYELIKDAKLGSKQVCFAEKQYDFATN